MGKISFWKRKFLWDLSMAIAIVVLPILLYVHVFFDNSSTTIEIFGYVYEHQYRNGARVFVWMVLVKSIPLLLLVLWFLNTRNWWRYFLFIPLIFWIDSLSRRTFNYSEFWENNLSLLTVLVNICMLISILVLDRYLVKYVSDIRFHLKNKGRFLKDLEQEYKKPELSSYSIYEKEAAGSYIRKLLVFESILRKEAGILFNTLGRKGTFQKFDTIVILALVSIPFIYHTYMLIPLEIKTYHVHGLTLGSYGFNDVNTFIWYVGLKLSLILPLMAWFITSQHWWRYAIFSPIILTIYQLWEAFQNTTGQVDEIEIFKAMPILVGVVAILIFLSRTINYQSRILELNDEVSGEIEEFFNQQESSLTDQKQRFGVLKKDGKNKAKAAESLESLLKLRAELLSRQK